MKFLHQGASKEGAMFAAFRQDKDLKHFTSCSLEGLAHRADWEDVMRVHNEK